MKAIILSAGKGSRMYPLTANTPKCLIDIGQGKSVLESQLDVLRDVGFKEVYVVAGYCISQVAAKISSYECKGMRVIVVHNPFYATTNNLVSLWLATLLVGGNVVTINGDDIFKRSVIEGLVTQQGDIVMTIDRKATYDSDDMLVVTNGECVKSVGKDLAHKSANGESVGIIKYSSRGFDLLRSVLDDMMRDEENHSKFYLKALQLIIDKGYPVGAWEIDVNDWAEIDFHPDVSEVRGKIDSFLERMR